MERIESPLGSASSLYRTKTQKTGNILDDPERGILELYPAGFTKPSALDDITRQYALSVLYNEAVKLGTEQNLYPFGKRTHRIELLHDPNNAYDKNAIHFIFRSNTGVLSKINGADLGFVPRKINAVILSNKSMIHTGYIYKVKMAVHGKYFNAKIVLGYGDTVLTPASQKGLSRFSDILEEA